MRKTLSQKIKKISNSNTSKDSTEKSTPSNFPDKIFSWNTMENSLFSVQTTAKELIEWAKNTPDAIKLDQFIVELKGWNRPAFYELADKYPQLKEAMKTALNLIGIRREKYSIFNNDLVRDTKNLIFMMPKYDPDWKEETERRAQLNKENTNLNSGIQNVYLPDFDKPKSLENLQRKTKELEKDGRREPDNTE